MKPNSTGSPGTTVSTRLLLLVLVPVTAIALLLGSVVVDHRSASASARQVEEGVDGLMEMVALRDALQVQQTASSFMLRVSELGTTTAVVSTYFGFDIAGPTEAARTTAHRAVAALGSRSPVARRTLDALYNSVDTHAVISGNVMERLAQLLDRTEEAMTKELYRLADVLLAANLDEGGLVTALQSLRMTNRLIRVAAREGVELSAVWFPSPGGQSAGAPTPLAALAADSAAYEIYLSRLREAAQPAVLASLGRVTMDARVRTFRTSVEETLRGRPYVATAEGVAPTVIATFAGYIERNLLLADLVKAAAADVRRQASELAVSESAALLEWTAVLAAGCLGLIGLGWTTARSISRPLRDLAKYAQAVNRGELDVEPSPRSRRGPREVRVAYGLFHDLVLSLRLLDAKATALAGCSLEDPVLRVPFPGRLGTSFERSVAVVADSIVERDALQGDLAFQSTHDPLTGIRNRAAAISELQAAIERAIRQRSFLAVLFLDLNEFKSVNDRFGHATGDAVLCEVAHRLTNCLRAVDFVARLGGDEFVIVAEDLDGLDGAVTLAQRVVATIEEPIVVGPNVVSVGVAVGIAPRSSDNLDALGLLSEADAAMYRSKRHERSGIEIFDVSLREEAAERSSVELALTEALRDPAGGGLCLHYQPVLTTSSGALAGVEALIRWNRSGNGLVPPDSFIPVAEASDLIIDVDCWVLDQAARQLVAWSISPDLDRLPIAVNVSGRHLLSGLLPTHLHDVFTRYAIDPSLLSVEVTETVLLSDLVAAGEQLDAVHGLGVRVAIDDFGTGYTSPAHLQFLPMDTIKIDRSFVSRVEEPRGRSLVRMIIDLGHAIDVAIVAEGVETEAELQTLTALGADFIQGFLLSRPMPADGVTAFAAERRQPVAGRPVAVSS